MANNKTNTFKLVAFLDCYLDFALQSAECVVVNSIISM